MRRDPALEKQPGFSLIELLIVVAIAAIAAAMTIPLATTVAAQYRLRTSAVDLQTLLQRARIQAIKDNRTYAVLTNAGVASGGYNYTQLWADTNGDQAFTPSEPRVVLQRDITLAGFGEVPAAIPAASLGFNPAQDAKALGAMRFNARGIPCMINPGGPGGGGVCSSWVPAGGGATPPVGYVYYLRGRRGNTGAAFSAVSVSPSGRFRVWSYSNSAGTWSY